MIDNITDFQYILAFVWDGYVILGTIQMSVPVAWCDSYWF